MSWLTDMLEIRVAHAFHKGDNEDDFTRINNFVPEHIAKILVWRDTTDDLNDWTETVINKGIAIFAGRKIRGFRKAKRIPRNTYKYWLFDTYAENFKDFCEWLEIKVANCIADGYPEPEPYDVRELWSRFCKFREACLDELEAKIPLTQNLRRLCKEILGTKG